MANAAFAVICGFLGSVLAIAVLAFAARTSVVIGLLGSTYRLAQVMRSAGITKFHRSRDDYGRTLRTYLSRAQQSIGIVSISLWQTHAEGDLIALFRQRLAENEDFKIAISLLAPRSDAVESASAALNVPAGELRREIGEMLAMLVRFKSSLHPDQQRRLQVSIHEALPMGSAILLDTQPNSGIIQIETKLHGAPRGESFGFAIVGPAPFYQRHFRAWTALLEGSRAPTQEDLVVK